MAISFVVLQLQIKLSIYPLQASVSLESINTVAKSTSLLLIDSFCKLNDYPGFSSGILTIVVD